MSPIARTAAQVALVAATLSACNRSEESRAADAAESATLAATPPAPDELRVSNVMIGRRIGPGNRVTEPSFEFAPRDTVYVSVATVGSQAGKLTAAWRAQSGEIVEQSSQPVRPSGDNTAFELSQPKGLKPGTYKVIVFLEEDSVDTKVFVVRK